jgi:hypothetical protein
MQAWQPVAKRGGFIKYIKHAPMGADAGSWGKEGGASTKGLRCGFGWPVLTACNYRAKGGRGSSSKQLGRA